jgi:hypothetical protein
VEAERDALARRCRQANDGTCELVRHARQSDFT